MGGLTSGGAYKPYKKLFGNEQIRNNLRLIYRAIHNTFSIYSRHNKSEI